MCIILTKALYSFNYRCIALNLVLNMCNGVFIIKLHIQYKLKTNAHVYKQTPYIMNVYSYSHSLNHVKSSDCDGTNLFTNKNVVEKNIISQCNSFKANACLTVLFTLRTCAAQILIETNKRIKLCQQDKACLKWYLVSHWPPSQCTFKRRTSRLSV